MNTAQAGTVLRHLRRLGPAAGPAEPSDAQLLERFAVRRDGAAFAALVGRYAPMVLNVCRSVLRHEQDAEDALQATFLVLARKAASIRRPEAVAGWLHEVAHRVAGRAQANSIRRREIERQALPVPAAESTMDMTLRDLQRVLHAELRRLPDKYRLPLVLCYLEGRSQAEAAGRLGWSKDTVRGRLDRGRHLLRRRLNARGIALSAVTCATLVAPATLTGQQLLSIVRLAPEASCQRATTLADGVIRAMHVTKIKTVTVTLLAASLVLTTVALAQRVTAGDPPSKSPATPVAKPPVAAPSVADNLDLTRYAGRIVGPNGQPVADAKVYLSHLGGYFREPLPTPASATTGPDGRFAFTVSNAKFEERWGAKVVAAAPKHGPGWVDVRPGGKRDDLTIRLVEDDIPITGQVVDLEGKPIPKVTLTVWQIHSAVGNDAGPWVEAAQGKKGLVLDLERKYFPRYITALCPKVTTGTDGKLRLTGIGRDRLVRGIIEGPTIATQHVCIVTRPGKPIDVVAHNGDREYGEPDTVSTYYGSDFRLVAAPCQPIIGVVRDRDTRKPIAGATVRSHSQLIGPSRFRGLDPVVQTTTDADGRYRLLGMPTGKGYSIAVLPPKDHPYVARHVDVPAGVGVEPATVDIDLRRGVWIEGKITDKATGKPLQGSVEYFSMYANPNLRDYPGFDGTFVMGELVIGAKADGSFRVAALPGPGVIGVYFQRDPYLRADQRTDEFAAKEKSLQTSPYHLMFTSNYNAIAKVDPAKGAESVTCNVTIDPGSTFQATVLGPDGKPLAGARAFNLNMDRRWGAPLMSAEFAGGFNPVRTYDIVAVHPETGLVGTAQPPMQSGGAVVVKMRPGATATGRLIGADGKPRAGVDLELSFRSPGWKAWHGYLPATIKTDADGRFRVEALVPEYEFRLNDDTGEVVFGHGLRSGQIKELGDVQLSPGEE
jgi:RNA polymerase sigma factor (sigma-70 family)